MASCATCGRSILFGAKKSGNEKYCSDKCLAAGQVVTAASQIPETVVRQQRCLRGRAAPGSAPRSP